MCHLSEFNIYVSCGVAPHLGVHPRECPCVDATETYLDMLKAALILLEMTEESRGLGKS